jgi:hypothetical protein
MKALLAAVLVLTGAQFAQAEGGECNPAIYESDCTTLVRDTAARAAKTMPITGPETPEEINAREAFERNPWINPAILDAQGRKAPVDPRAKDPNWQTQTACGSFFKTMKKAAYSCPSFAEVRSILGVGLLCDCSNQNR